MDRKAFPQAARDHRHGALHAGGPLGVWIVADVFESDESPGEGVQRRRGTWRTPGHVLRAGEVHVHPKWIPKTRTLKVRRRNWRIPGMN